MISHPRSLFSKAIIIALALWIVPAAYSTSSSTASARASSADPLNTTITLDYGTFIGTRNTTSGILSFKGVRYADAPTGDTRFRAPISPPTTHLGTVNATKFADICIQATSSSVTGDASEDCLFGNIYVPVGTTPDSQLPVLVFFHGGGFQGGSTRSYFPDLLLDTSVEPVIFATFAYRLGAFGFLSGSEVFSNGDGNAGLLDQRAALRWVQTYISAFGGNSANVTIWGQSAGAGSTMFQLMAKGGNSEGLFHGVMGDSPSLNFLPPYNDGAVETLYQQFAINAGCGDANDTLACLRAADVNTLANASSVTLVARPTSLYPFAPIVDGKFLLERPSVAFANGQFAKVPVSFGSNTNEGNNWSQDLPSPSANVSEPGATNQTLFTFFAGQFPNVTQETFTQIEKQYPIESYNNSLIRQTSAIYGEARYICTAMMITGSATNYNITAHGYHYDNPDAEGFSVHGSELPAFFTFANSSLPLFTAMRQYFTSFATGGVPVATVDDPSNNAAWEPVNTTTGMSRILFHPEAVAMELDDALVSRCQFWRTTDDELQR